MPVQFTRPMLVTNSSCCSDPRVMCERCASAALNRTAKQSNAGNRGLVTNPSQSNRDDDWTENINALSDYYDMPTAEQNDEDVRDMTTFETALTRNCNGPGHKPISEAKRRQMRDKAAIAKQLNDRWPDEGFAADPDDDEDLRTAPDDDDDDGDDDVSAMTPQEIDYAAEARRRHR